MYCENSFFQNTLSSPSITNTKTKIVNKVLSITKVYIKNFAHEYQKVNTDEFLNFKTNRYEKSLKIKKIFSVAIGIIIGALCICFVGG